jgi:hypothetical protein
MAFVVKAWVHQLAKIAQIFKLSTIFSKFAAY